MYECHFMLVIFRYKRISTFTECLHWTEIGDISIIFFVCVCDWQNNLDFTSLSFKNITQNISALKKLT